MTSVNVTTTKNTVTVNGETRVVTVKTAGPQGAQGVLQTGDLGDITVTTSGSGTQTVAINTGAVTSTKLANSGVTSGSYGSSSAIPTITVDSKGLITAASTNSIDTDLLADISPQLGGNLDLNSKNITGTGDINITGDITISKAFNPSITFNDGNNENDFEISNAGGLFRIRDIDAGFNRFTISSASGANSGVTSINNHLDVSNGLDVTGDISVSGTVDSVDLSTYQADGGSYLRSDADDSFTGTLTAQSDASNPVIKINGPGPNFIRFDQNTGDTSDAIDLIYRTSPNTLGFERVSDAQKMFTIDADDQQAIFNGNVDCNAGLDVSGGDITGTLGSGVIGTTQSATDDSTKIATTAFVKTAVSNLVDSAPSTLDTLNELAAALGDNPNFATTVTTSIGEKLPLAGGTLTGNLTINTTAPLITFNESDTSKIFNLVLDGSALSIRKDSNAGSNIVQRWNSDGHVDFLNNVDFAGNITLPDNGKIILGDEGETDSFISFNGTNLLIKETSPTGSLRLTGHNLFLTNPTQNDETYLKCNGQSTDRNVELYCEGTQRLETSSTGISVTGEITGTSHLDLPSDARLNLGDNNEFFIFHQSSNGNSIIKENGGGSLSIQTNGANITFYDTANSRSMAQFNTGGSCVFKHAADIRLETTSTGMAVTGRIAQSDTAGSANTFGTNVQINTIFPSLSLNDTDSENDFQLQNQNGLFVIKDADRNVNVFTIEGRSGQSNYGETGIAGDLAVDTDTLFVDSTNDKVGINQASPEGALDVNGQIRSFSTTGTSASGLKVSSANENVHLYLQNGNSNAVFNISYGGSGGNDIAITHDGIVKLFNGGGTTPKLATSATGVNVTGDVVATGHLRNSVPTDFWNSGSYFEVGDLGHISTHGGFEFTLTSGGYRRQVNGVGKWKDITVDGVSGFGCQVALAPKTGKIHFRSNSGLSTDDNNPDNAVLTDRLTVDQGGITVSGGIGLTGALLVGNEINMFNGTTNSHRFIDCGLGDNNDLRIRGCSGGDANHENMIVATRGSSVRLHHDGATTAKLETSATGATINGELEIASAGGLSSSPSLYVNNSSSRSYINSGQLLTPNITAGQQNILVIGKARATKQAGFIGYKFSSANSNELDDNLLTFNHWGANELVTINGQGNVVATGDGTFDDIRIGEWAGNSSFAGVLHKNHGGSEYMMINNGSSTSGHTYISATTGMNVVIRGGANNLANQIEVEPTNGINLTAANNVNILDGNIDFGSNADNNPVISMKDDNNRVKYRVFTNSDFGMGFSGNITHGGLNGHCVTFQVSNNSNRGWLFLNSAQSLDKGAMALTSDGKMSVTHSIRLGYGESDTTIPGATHALDVSGSAIISSSLTAGGLTFPTVNGNDGQVLTSDGAGNVQWEDSTGTFNGGTIQNELILDPSDSTPPKLRFIPTSASERHFYFEQDSSGLKIMNQTADGNTQTIFWRIETGENEVYQSIMHRKTADFTFSNVYPHINAKAAHSRNKINLYSGFNFQIGTENVTYGGLNSSAITFSCTNNDASGFIFTSPGHGSDDGAMAITANGKVTIAHSLRLGYGTDDDTTTPGATHALDVSGSISSTSTISATTSNASSSNNIRKITTSTSQPSGGADGDIWIVVPS